MRRLPPLARAQVRGFEADFYWATHRIVVGDKALERGTGARGLRAIIEEVLLHVMYDVPSRGDVEKVIVTREVVDEDAVPTLVVRETKPKKKSA